MQVGPNADIVKVTPKKVEITAGEPYFPLSGGVVMVVAVVVVTAAAAVVLFTRTAVRIPYLSRSCSVLTLDEVSYLGSTTCHDEMRTSLSVGRYF